MCVNGKCKYSNFNNFEKMDKAKLHSEIHNGILYFKSGDIDEHVLQITIEKLIDDYHESQLKLLNLHGVSGSLLLDKDTMADEYEQAVKRYGFDNKHTLADAYLDGLKDGAKHYRLVSNDR